MSTEQVEDFRLWYGQRGMSGRMGFGQRPALLVVDVQRGFTDPRCPLGSEADSMVHAIRGLLSTARSGGIPIAYTICYWTESTWSLKIPAQRVLQPGSEWVELDSRVAAEPDDLVVHKNFASAFFATPLDGYLRSGGVDTVVVTGMTTSGCVRASVVDGCSSGYRVIVPEEAVADRLAAAHDMSLCDIDAKYGDVMPVRDVAARLQDLSA
jgi:maleamate amidohydrolase